jgi:peptidyl-prolyl cis-trans isomerase D
MLNLFRRLSKSKLGGLVFALFLVAIALGFVTADIQSLGISGGASGDTVAKIGRESIGYNELRQRVQRAFDNARQEKPELTIQQFVQQGGVDGVLGQMADGLALTQFAKRQGFGVSRKMEDAQIASAAAFRGLNGQFDQSAFEAFLNRERISEKQLRTDLARDLYLNQLLVPATGASLAPPSLALPYASMLLEQRSGRAQFVPVAAMRGAPPTDAEVAAFYRANAARYTIPERRVVRYALVDRAAYQAAALPSEAEIAKAYAANKADYAGKETRTVSQVILPTEATARELAAKIAAGTPIAQAAQGVGLESVTLADQSREAFAEAAAPAVAAAVFATPKGQVAPPTRSGLGWHVARVDGVNTVAGKTLAQVRDELTTRLSKEKADQLMADAVAKIEDAVADGATFDEVVAANKLQPVTTPALLADGRNPDAATAPVAPEIAPIMKSAFAADPNDDPVVETITANERYAVVKVDRAVPATPRPLASIREQVAADFSRDRAFRAARQIAEAIAAKANGSAPLAQAAGGAGVPLPAAGTVAGRRGQVLQTGQPLDPQVAALFQLVKGKARVVPAADRSGFHVVQLETVVQGDARSQPQLIEATRQQFSPVLGQEYGRQLAAAARQSIGVDINGAAVARLKSELIGGTAGQ